MPTPVSTTAKLNRRPAPPLLRRHRRGRRPARRRRRGWYTQPEPVNLTALLHRLVRICVSRVESPVTGSSSIGSISQVKLRPFSAALGANKPCTWRTQSAGMNGAASSSIRPASILARSRTSVTSRFKVLADDSMVWTISRWRGSRWVRDSKLARPTTPFNGVRISWLMLDRNSLLARSAASALRRASSISASASVSVSVRSARALLASRRRPASAAWRSNRRSTKAQARARQKMTPTAPAIAQANCPA